jgi:hypothetical protein
LTLTSRTMPSKASCKLKRFWNDNIPPAEGTAIIGLINLLSPICESGRANATLGPLAGKVVEVVHEVPNPVTVVVHPVGRFGAVTSSKFSEKVTPHGVGIGVAVAEGDVMGVGVGEGVIPGERVGVGVGVDGGVGVGVSGGANVGLGVVGGVGGGVGVDIGVAVALGVGVGVALGVGVGVVPPPSAVGP